MLGFFFPPGNTFLHFSGTVSSGKTCLPGSAPSRRGQDPLPPPGSARPTPFCPFHPDSLFLPGFPLLTFSFLFLIQARFTPHRARRSVPGATTPVDPEPPSPCPGEAAVLLILVKTFAEGQKKLQNPTKPLIFRQGSARLEQRSVTLEPCCLPEDWGFFFPGRYWVRANNIQIPLIRRIWPVSPRAPVFPHLLPHPRPRRSPGRRRTRSHTINPAAAGEGAGEVQGWGFPN